jgi:hypothetical protein
MIVDVRRKKVINNTEARPFQNYSKFPAAAFKNLELF